MNKLNQRPSLDAIVSPRMDLILSGGGSVVFVLGVLLVGVLAPQTQWLMFGIGAVPMLLLQAGLNMPHFMASYPLLYGKRERMSKHRFVALYLPCLLFILCICALLFPGEGTGLANPWVIEFLEVLTYLLLAWHYTGQAWGMVCSFAFLGGVQMNNRERLLIRMGLHVLLVWHVLWVIWEQLLDPLKKPSIEWVETLRTAVPELFPCVELLYGIWTYVAMLSLPVGIYGFVHVYLRTGTSLPLRSVVPWFAIYLWYLLIFLYPGFFPLVQIFHALQYLAFPLRVEINQFAERCPDQKHRQVRHTVYYYLVLVGIGLVVWMVPQFTLYIGDETMAVSALAAGFINTHHYFIDGVIWKLRNPDVSRALFAHLKSRG